MKLSEELQWRGFVNQTTLPDLSVLDDKKITFYHGFDASSDSQTIGNLAAMMLDMTFIRHGHDAILLAGGATSLIGDPGGKDSERVLQSEEIIRTNVAKAEEQLKNIFNKQNFKLVNNLDWFKGMGVLEFLRDVGKYYGMSTLLQRDYIQARIGEDGTGMSFTEFSYTLLQGYDYLYLFDTYNVTLQLAGSDQWGNSLSGVDLIRKTRGKETHVLTLPLIINKATGKKFGKSEAGAVWLDLNKTSVYQFYQFWLNVDDEGVAGYLKIFTLIQPNEHDKLMAEFRVNPGKRPAQKYLAYEVTKIVHGEASANSARRVTETLFGSKDVSDLTHDDLELLAQEIPRTSLNKSVIDSLVEAGAVASNSEARRLVESGAISVNGEKIFTDQEVVTVSLIKKGKNSFVLAR